MKLLGVTFGASIAIFFKGIVKAFKVIIEIFARAIICLGLYFPIGYLIVGGILNGLLGFKPFDLGQNSIMYIAGLILFFVLGLLLSLRIFIYKKNKKQAINYPNNYQADVEAPLIYRSKKDPKLIIYEYNNRYDLYIENGKNLVFLRTEKK